MHFSTEALIQGKKVQADMDAQARREAEAAADSHNAGTAALLTFGALFMAVNFLSSED